MGSSIPVLRRATGPIGNFIINATANGGTVTVATTQSSSPTILSPAFGDAVARSQALTTVGYGDITPLHPMARDIANLEAVLGQLYPATLLARLVTLEMAHRS